MTKPIRLLIADDHPIVRHGISSCLARQQTIQIIGEAGDGREALSRTRELRPDVVLMDIDMPQMNGLAVTDLLRREMPQVKVLILSMYSNSEYALRIIQCGARGFVLKEAPPEEIVHAIEAVYAGTAHFSPDVARVALNQVVRGHGESAGPARLTSREREVLMHIAEGQSNKEIAGQLKIGVRTVETHRERIMRKLDIHSIAGLTRFAIAQGMVSLMPASLPQLLAAA
ncbi:MAG: response regulator transcription factor [Verrucomicrobia subdivision 3 bacterium]|nr:response regulator transcription factor [Limisphaerales bacterium]